MLRDIRQAKRTVNLETFNFQKDEGGEQFAEALMAAAKNGVQVRLLIDDYGSSLKSLPMVRSASWFHYGEMLKGGVKIFEYKPTMMHNKTCVIDGLYATIGSINFDGRSMKTNAEESLAFYDGGFAAKMEAMFQEDKKKSEEITYKAFKNRGPHRRLTELVFWIWEPYY